MKTSPREDILVNENLLVSGDWKYVRPNTNMIEASWGGLAYPNHTESGNSNYIDNYHLKCGAAGCLFNIKVSQDGVSPMPFAAWYSISKRRVRVCGMVGDGRYHSWTTRNRRKSRRRTPRLWRR